MNAVERHTTRALNAGLVALTRAVNRHPAATRRILFALAVVFVYAAAFAVDSLAHLVGREIAPLL